jgi:murein DD-endopeptidase MepM/ murein hydrolase activator NlpD
MTLHFGRRQLIGLAVASVIAFCCCGNYDFDSDEMKKHSNRLRETGSFRYPMDDYFPETPVTDRDPPKTERGEKHHTAEDSFAPQGTPVYAIGDGIISYSGRARGYGWLIIIDHPVENVYSLYGHLSTSRSKKESGDVKKGEWIAYLGEAEEAETMHSHIHFGMRMGQRTDYPFWGDARWMAGYTESRPERLGWFKPSEIIGQTDSMREWHKYIRKREDIVTGRSLRASDFKITSGEYNERQDLDQMIRTEFGDQYRLADWRDILPFSENIQEWAESVGIAEGEENALLISNDGYRIWLSRQYYISRFNHNKPKHFLAHDDMDNDFVCLGSWLGLNERVLAVRK